MNGTNSRVSIGSLILVPAAITLAITILRLVGELEGWSPLFFNKSAGGGGAIMGISWLPIIFGPYFAWKLATAGEGPSSFGKAIGICVLAFVVFALGVVAFGVGINKHVNALDLVGIVVILASLFIPRVGWRSLGNTLLAYAFAARIPVVVVYFLAMSGNGGQGWGTHYDVVTPGFKVTSFAQKFIQLALVPQMTFWVGWTVMIGGLLGSIFAVVFARRTASQPAAG